MKITILGPAYPYRGGIAAFNERLAREFLSQGHEVKIYTYTLQYPSFLFPGKTQLSEDPPPKNLNIERAVNSVQPANWWSVGRRIRDEKPDLLIAPFWMPLMSMSASGIMKQVQKNNHTKLLGLVHNMIPHESKPGDKPLSRRFVKLVDGFMAMSQAVLDDIGQFNGDKPRSLSPHPIYDHFGSIAPREDALKAINLDPDYRYLLFFGLIRKYKGLDLLLKAFADERFRDKKVKLLVAGEYYGKRDAYDQIIAENNLADQIVAVEKFIPDSEVAHYFNAADLVVQPYHSATQSGVTQIAYHFNKPMIVTDVGGLAEMCPDGKVGYVAQPEPKSISEAMLRFLNEADQEAMAANVAIEKKKYSWEVLTENIFTLAQSFDLNAR